MKNLINLNIPTDSICRILAARSKIYDRELLITKALNSMIFVDDLSYKKIINRRLEGVFNKTFRSKYDSGVRNSLK